MMYFFPHSLYNTNYILFNNHRMNFLEKRLFQIWLKKKIVIAKNIIISIYFLNIITSSNRVGI